MPRAPLLPIPLNTAHLLLWPIVAADADRAFEIQSDRDVTRTLAMAPFPPDGAEIVRWFGEHSQERLAGSACRIAVVRQTKLIGVVDVARISHGEDALGSSGLDTPQRSRGPSPNSHSTF
jgi:[ribosomal protein S5]-alanine N-acetyltransferase